MGKPIFDIAVCTIFAREVLEGSIIIGQYRMVLQKSPDWQDPEKQKAGFREITRAALLASVVAVVVCVAVAIPLVIASKELNDTVVDVIEGVSKVVAAICILQLSVKIPKWLGLYASKKSSGSNSFGELTLKSIRFNVAWNIWREVAECGVFLIPFFLRGDDAIAIPLSAVIGIIVSLVLGAIMYYGSKYLENKFWLAFFLSALTGMLSVGLFTGGCHKFEEAWGETPTVWSINGEGWSHERLPMTIIKPFGYSSSRTVLQICCFWSWFIILIGFHVWKIDQTQKLRKTGSITSDDDEEKVSKDMISYDLEMSNDSHCSSCMDEHMNSL
mmetsp:Transcript_13401/g.19170  ORF Transcript_13401/g.19170 Transcript_13401/m.19170 type:complete len:329 (-) Transcript_13401:257-1243(-)